MNLTDSLQFHLVVMQIVDSLSDKVATTLRTNQSKQNYDFQLTPLNCEMKVFRVVSSLLLGFVPISAVQCQDRTTIPLNKKSLLQFKLSLCKIKKIHVVF